MVNAVKIEPPADDHGLQNLKATDAAKGQAQPVDHIERSARIATTEERREAVPVVRGGERRSGRDRRQQQEPTPLDTREPHERRTDKRRTEDRAVPEETDEEAHKGIDQQA